MATPIPAAAQQVAQVAQQQQVARPEATPKTGASKFDQAMAHKAEAAQATSQVTKAQAAQATQQTQKATHATQVERTGKVDDLKQANATKREAPVGQKGQVEKARNSVEQLLTQIENRNAAMGEFVNSAISGKIKLNQQQLLGLQAKVSEYSLELDLTGKVVEKATNGLKDTLRTQV